jgi:uncharacterized protein YgfB (UPF0149 family)
MSANQTVDPEDVAELIGHCKLTISVSEFHGSLVGFISAGGHFRQGSLLDALQLEADPAPAADELAMLARLRHQVEASLADPDLTFEPWLPEDDASLGDRTTALVEWTGGFLGGFGLGGTPETANTLTEDAQEVLRDLVSIATSDFEFEEGDADEDALIEIVEFVRVGALLLHAEVGARHEPASDTRH